MLLIYWPQKLALQFRPQNIRQYNFYQKKGLTPTKKSLIKDQVIGEDQMK